VQTIGAAARRTASMIARLLPEGLSSVTTRTSANCAFNFRSSAGAAAVVGEDDLEREFPRQRRADFGRDGCHVLGLVADRDDDGEVHAGWRNFDWSRPGV
jgi:hypothetical protein